MGKFLSCIKRNTSGPLCKDLNNLERRHLKTARPGVLVAVRELVGEHVPPGERHQQSVHPFKFNLTPKKIKCLGKFFMSPASSAALITGLFQSKSSQMARPRRPRGVSTTTTCNVKMTTVNTAASNDGEENRPPVVWGRCRRLVTRMSKGCTCAKLCEVMTTP